MEDALPIVNLGTARFECTYGRGCDGVCCREGHPLVYPDEIDRLESGMARILARLRPEARAVIEQKGFLRKQTRYGHPTVRNAGGWCVFFHAGCVLHQVGTEDGDAFRYKPAVCALFPLQKDEHERWYVRQSGLPGERWDLFCLAPGPDTPPAAETLRAEIELAARFDAEAAG